jgi:hypothetical protein
MTLTTHWPAETLAPIALADDLHIAPQRTNGETGTPTWVWSVAVDGVLYVRPYRGAGSSWYQSARTTGAGIIRSGGSTYEVLFTPVSEPDLLASVDREYARKYDGSPYLAAMLQSGPRDHTLAVRLAS